MTTLQDLGLAYRKAKVDLYYSSHPSLNAIADYEENLHSNLSELQKKIDGEDESWVTQADFIGSWTLASTSVDMDGWKDHRKGGLIFSSPADEWEYACKDLADTKASKKPKAEFRVMAKCSLSFHVLSTLWMMEVGHLFDAKLTDCSYGNRLRRTQDGKRINPLSLGSFKPYLKPFRDWRDNGIAAMRDALNADRKIVALTADVSSFYHELNPDFMLAPSFIENVLGLELSEEHLKLNRLFISALKAWSANTPLKRGLPVGLPASAVVANIALVELDRCIEQEVAPIYYGRYVDDILLVMENGADFGSTVQLWEWLFARADGKLGWVEENKGNNVCFKPDYLNQGDGKSRIHFANGKNKVFILEGESGKTMVDAIAHQIHERASEWRAMPRLPQSAEHVGTDLLAASQSDGEAADNLRKADALTMRRAGFAIKLRDFEAYERDLLPEAWAEHRRAFIRAFTQHVVVLPRFFDLAIYLPRVIRLITACEDFSELRRVLEALEKLCKQVEDQCTVGIKAWPEGEEKPSATEMIKRWQEQLFSSIHESISAAFLPRLSKVGKQAWQEHMADFIPSISLYNLISWPVSAKGFQTKQARLYSFDLAHMPFRFIGLPKEMVAQRGIPAKKAITNYIKTTDFLPDDLLIGAIHLAEWIRFKQLPNGLVFSTRPFNLPELFILNRNPYAESEQEEMRKVVLAVRGFELSGKSPCFDKSNRVLNIPIDASTQKFTIAVSSWQTQLNSWAASVKRMPDPDVDRYSRLCRLLDGVIAQPRNSRYLVLPELALPAHWFIRIARKLQGRGISLITGVEYLHASKGRVRNQVWAALSHDGLGFPSLMIYRQDKQRPALHEEQELHRMAGLELRPDKEWKKPPIIQHGGFRFALLICSELTNISYRADLCGKVDALFVPEWNPDTETFNALVESASLDMHAYIIQCNDRQYGDSRIRAPFKDSWKRDVLRVKGGVTDYCVIGEIDVQSLREFQSSHRSPDKPYKPVPDGFNDAMDYNRKVLPAGGNES
ncbi:Reverse transcriptase [Mariprofundus erugo]|uniref:Reverse transcriptase n=1 Tax=Mariprofundus erugo TaxID=2528639 RepID=A0A5R9GH91_9PROT|nr:reverse transcriptase domain-containing protein [Mariprofundus erugo]TLS66186.1 Reverse transcriptase [Mariprofundus erugo]